MIDFFFDIMDKDRFVFDVSSEDRRRVFKFFFVNFRVYCIMEDYVNFIKDSDSDDYWIAAKRFKVMAVFRRVFFSVEWDMLIIIIDF